jgi:hypothetical protein
MSEPTIAELVELFRSHEHLLTEAGGNYGRPAGQEEQEPAVVVERDLPL